MTRSCPESCNDSSDSEKSLEDFCAVTDGEFGLPSRCFCGQLVRLTVCNTVENKGRKFYKCPSYEDGRPHVYKWWDDAVAEELKKLSFRLNEQKASIQNAFRYGGSASLSLESIREAMQLMRIEIDDVKDRLLQKDEEIESLKERLRGWV